MLSRFLSSFPFFFSSHLYHQAKHDFAKFGISTGEVSMDLDKMMENKDSIVNGLTGGIEFLFKKYAHIPERVFDLLYSASSSYCLGFTYYIHVLT